MTPASLLRRLGAMLYDAFLLIAIWMSSLWIIVPITDAPVSGPWVQGLLLIEAFAFFAFFWIRNRQTLGMQAWRIRVQNANGSAITLNQCLIRFFAGALSLLLMGLGHWWILVDRQRRSWSDILSGSEVVFDPHRSSAAMGGAASAANDGARAPGQLDGDQPQRHADGDSHGQEQRDPPPAPRA